MADRLTIARPYARAAFRVSGRKAADCWSKLLHVAASTVQDARVAALLGNPHVTPQQVAELVIGVIEDAGGVGLAGEEAKNFVRTLADNRRLGYLPEIAARFDTLKDAAFGIADVAVTSAEALDKTEQDKLAAALAKKLDRQVRLHYDVDKNLIGGAVLRTGDLVIDGSLRTRLERLAYELTA
jgi:F-type H+-transporting ATPase subunit delta